MKFKNERLIQSKERPSLPLQKYGIPNDAQLAAVRPHAALDNRYSPAHRLRHAHAVHSLQILT